MRQNSEHREAIDSIRNYYSPLIVHAESGAREYAQLALKSIISLNAGVAVAYPAIAELFLDNLTIREFIAPVTIAVAGAVFGVIASYVVYFNHGYEAQTHFTQMELEILSADEHFDNQTYFRFQSHRRKSKEHWQKYNTRFDKLRDVTFYVANAVGVLAVICFASSVILFAFSVGS